MNDNKNNNKEKNYINTNNNKNKNQTNTNNNKNKNQTNTNNNKNNILNKRNNNKTQNGTKKYYQKFYDEKLWFLESIPLIIFCLMIILAIYMHPILPKNVPIHWNASGVADNFGSKNIALFLIPGIYIIILLLLIILPAIDVYKDNIKKFYKHYVYFKIMFALFFLALYISTLLPNFGYTINISTLVLVLIGILFIYLGYIMKYFKRNFFIGIRTAWTLSDDEVWEETHKNGGLAFLILGLLTVFVTIFFESTIAFTIFMILTIIISLGIVVYSYIIYKKKYNN